jgi:hypothetical protein
VCVCVCVHPFECVCKSLQHFFTTASLCMCWDLNILTFLLENTGLVRVALGFDPDTCSRSIFVSLWSIRYTTKAILFTRKLEVPSVWRKVSTATASHCSCAVIKSIDAHLLQRFSIQTIDLPCVLAFDKTGSQV